MKPVRSVLLLALIICHGANVLCQNKPEYPGILNGPYLDQVPPGNKSQVFAPGFVSTEAGELNSVFSADGNEFYFSRRGIPGKPSAIMVTRMLNNEWTKPVPVDFSGTYDDVDLFITADGKSMIYCSDRTINKGGMVMMNHDFMIAQHANSKWTNPVPFAQVTASEFEDYFPVLTKNGNLYFNSQREGQGTNDIFCSRFINGKYFFFTSNKNGNEDIFWISSKIIDALRNNNL